MEVKNIIFDLGGVLIDLDMSRTHRAFQQFFGEKAVELEHGYLKSRLLRRYEVGAIDTETFLDELQGLAPAVGREAIVEAWNAMLLGIPEKRLRMLEQLGERYRLFVLSNTNALHEACFEKMAPGYEKFSGLFEKAYYSHHLGTRKPELDIYQKVLQQSSLKAEETLFVDDLADNVQAAQKLRLQTLLIEPGLEPAEYFKNW